MNNKKWEASRDKKLYQLSSILKSLSQKLFLSNIVAQARRSEGILQRKFYMMQLYLVILAASNKTMEFL